MVKCKRCHAAYMKEYTKRPAAKASAKSRRSSPEFKAKRRDHRKMNPEPKRPEYFRKYYHEKSKGTPELKARKRVGYAVSRGKIPKASTLQCGCGKQAQHYHHHRGYAPEFWLDVIPVCALCHKKAE